MSDAGRPSGSANIPQKTASRSQKIQVLRDLRAARIASGKTIVEVAAATGYHHKTIAGLEHQPRAVIQHLVDIADCLGYEIALVPKSKSRGR